MSGATDTSLPKFRGDNWEDLNRWVNRTKFEAMLDSDLREDVGDGVIRQDDKAMCAYLTKNCEGAAFDWISSSYTANPAIFNSFDGFIAALRRGFGIAEENITALCRSKLENLKMGSDVPTFFAEVDRLFLALGITGDEAKIAHVMPKVPHHIKLSLAEQGRMFHNYDTMREWMNTRWALMPPTGQKSAKAKTKCGNCGRKGHVASECRTSKN